jgi:hypothetical protein
MNSFLIVLINLEAVLVCALFNNLSSCGHYEITMLSPLFGLQSALSALAALVFWFGLKNQKSAWLFTLLNAVSVAGCLAGTLPFQMGCTV